MYRRCNKCTKYNLEKKSTTLTDQDHCDNLTAYAYLTNNIYNNNKKFLRDPIFFIKF